MSRPEHIRHQDLTRSSGGFFGSMGLQIGAVGFKHTAIDITHRLSHAFGGIEFLGALTTGLTERRSHVGIGSQFQDGFIKGLLITAFNHPAVIASI